MPFLLSESELVDVVGLEIVMTTVSNQRAAILCTRHTSRPRGISGGVDMGKCRLAPYTICRSGTGRRRQILRLCLQVPGARALLRVFEYRVPKMVTLIPWSVDCSDVRNGRIQPGDLSLVVSTLTSAIFSSCCTAENAVRGLTSIFKLTTGSTHSHLTPIACSG